MNSDILITLTTGDWVKNNKTNQRIMVIAIGLHHPFLKGIEELIPIEDWDLERSRLIVTDEEHRKIKEYHDKIKKQMEK